tara:strand:+ start:350 stop:550 length:201 start_codon:yes stop_codon:yes gene_type:complete
LDALFESGVVTFIFILDGDGLAWEDDMKDSGNLNVAFYCRLLQTFKLFAFRKKGFLYKKASMVWQL